jgi:hypothetical protein
MKAEGLTKSKVLLQIACSKHSYNAAAVFVYY